MRLLWSVLSWPRASHPNGFPGDLVLECSGNKKGEEGLCQGVCTTSIGSITGHRTSFPLCLIEFLGKGQFAESLGEGGAEAVVILGSTQNLLWGRVGPAVLLPPPPLLLSQRSSDCILVLPEVSRTCLCCSQTRQALGHTQPQSLNSHNHVLITHSNAPGRRHHFLFLFLFF